ncbi:hypothetical protein GDO86_014394 [Hymenochirus boettgeri]|uniref:Meiosis-specific coiled-coil domain-containing protein MEIOC n=1 Tax=Hymenochirus boettgeri TaxID=247094 RepID=A0A8T2JTV8_9PIPI|nr:hypothetical protein GDO86_014394 [Hymenochirus boettgeri]
MESNSVEGAHQNYDSCLVGVPLDCSTSLAESSLTYTPWCTYGDDTKQASIPQCKTKIQAETNEHGSQSDLYRLVSKILEEPDHHSQPYLIEGGYSSILKSTLPRNTNNFPDHEEKKLPEQTIFHKNVCINDSSHDIQTMQDICYGLNGLQQAEQFLFQSRSDSPGFYDNSMQMTSLETPFEKNGLQPSIGSKDFEQKWMGMCNSQFYTDSNNREGVQYDLIKQDESSRLGFYTWENDTDVSSEVFNVDIGSNFGILQAKQQSYPFITDKLYVKDTFVPDLNFKSDHGQKILDFSNTIENSHCSFSLQNSIKPTMKQYPAAKKNSPRNVELATTYAPFVTQGITFPFHKNWQLNPGAFEYNYCNFDKKQKNLVKTEEMLAEEQKFKPYNDYCDCFTYPLGPLDNTRMQVQAKSQNIQHGAMKKNLESIPPSYKHLIDCSLNYKSQKQENVGKKPKGVTNKPNFHQAACCSKQLGMSDIGSTFYSLPFSKVRSHRPNPMGLSFNPSLDPCLPCSYEDTVKWYPNFNDSIYGEGQYFCLAPPEYGFCGPVKFQNMPSNEFHICLEECYEQGRAMEKERKKTELILTRHYPGKQVLSSNNITIPRLTSNPSRVDRMIVDHLREHARVVTLLGGMERLRSYPLHENISTALDRQLEAIHIVQMRRKDEIANALNYQRQGGSCCQDKRDVFALALSIKNLSAATRKARTALWCALQMTLPRLSCTSSMGDVETVDSKTTIPHVK